MKKFFKEFKQFISRGNVMNMAIGVIIGSAFSSIITSLTNKILMPVINYLLASGGENGLESAYTFLERGYTDGVLDLSKSIYIDWGAFITAIINFLMIAIILFLLMKMLMSAQGFLDKQIKSGPSKEEKKVLKEQGVDMKNRRAVLEATKELREKNKPAPAPKKPTQEELLASILEELKKQNSAN